MTYIIVHGQEHDRKRLKGKTITEFAKNMESEGWPTELNPEERDRIKYAEKRNRHALKTEDSIKIRANMGINLKRDILEKAKKQGLIHYRYGYPK